MRQIKAQYSLLALLLAIAATVIFPALGRVGLQSDEIMLADLARQFSSSGVSSVFDGHGTDFPGNFYAYLVSLTKNMFQLTDAFAVRLPSAIIIPYFGENDKDSSKDFSQIAKFYPSFIFFS